MAGNSRVPALDGLRGIAVIGVFASHTGYPVLRNGWIGVEVFFVLSGFLITTLLLAEHERTGMISLRRFYMRRVLRLYPALVVALVLAGALVVALGASPSRYLGHAVVGALYLQDFASGLFDSHGPMNHTWTLAVEEQFYLVWPLVLIFVLKHRWRLTRALVAATVLGLLALLAFPGSRHDDGWYWLPWTYAPVLLAGCLVAAVWRTREPRLPGTPIAVLGLAGVLVVVLTADRLSNVGHAAAILALAAVATSMTIWGVLVAPHGVISRSLAWPPLAKLGLVSYGFYLLHLPALMVVSQLELRRSVTACVGFALAVVLATLSFRWVELPFLRMKEAWLSPNESGALTAPSSTHR
jgi:peptidoglycan/LPS O-acetylase OafA/YrhL